MSNYPPGVTAAHSHFNPDECPRCENLLEPDGDGFFCTNPECGFAAHPDDRYDTDPRV